MLEHVKVPVEVSHELSQVLDLVLLLTPLGVELLVLSLKECHFLLQRNVFLHHLGKVAVDCGESLGQETVLALQVLSVADSLPRKGLKSSLEVPIDLSFLFQIGFKVPDQFFLYNQAL
jgi:hypothetical protein